MNDEDAMKKTLLCALGCWVALLLPPGVAAAPDAYQPAVAHDPVNNSYLSVFADVFNATSSIYGELRDAAGEPAGDPVRLSGMDGAVMRQFPAVDRISENGHFLAVWSESAFLPDTNIRYWRVLGRLVAPDGLPLEGRIPITGYVSQGEMAPQVACSDGLCLVVWQTRACYSLGPTQICNQAIAAREVDANGALVQEEAFLLTPSNEEPRLQAFPAVACDPASGRSLVVWQDDLNADTTGWDIHGRLVEAGGALIGDERILSAADADQTLPAVAFDRLGGRYLAVWTDGRNAEAQGADIFGRLAGSEGDLIGDDFPISDTAAEAFDPAVVFLETGRRFLTAWQDDRGGELTGWDVYGRFLDAEGAADGLEIAIAATGGRDTRPALAYNPLDVSVLAAYETVQDDVPVQAYRVISARKPPTAAAGPDQSAEEGSLVTLDGSASAPWDPAASIVSYQWIQVGGLPVALSGAESAVASFTAPLGGALGRLLAFLLVVTDSAGLQGADMALVRVTDLPLPPVAEAGPDQFVDEGTRVTLDGSLSRPSDPFYPIAAFRWRQTGGTPVSLSGAETAIATFTAPMVPLEGARLDFELEVRDASALASSDTVTITVDDRSPRTFRLTLPSGAYSEVGFPVEADPDLLHQITAQLGPYDIKRFRLFRWDPETGKNIEIVGPGWGAEQACVPGRGYWAIARDPATLDITGTPASIRRPCRVLLHPGWNQLAGPFFFDVGWNDRILVSDGTEESLIPVTAEENTLTSRVILEYDSATGQYAIASGLRMGRGYWIENLTPEDVELLIPPEPAALSNGSKTTEAGMGTYDGPPPPLPPEGLGKTRRRP